VYAKSLLRRTTQEEKNFQHHWPEASDECMVAERSLLASIQMLALLAPLSQHHQTIAASAEGGSSGGDKPPPLTLKHPYLAQFTMK
jgi:hypothetical protein